MVLKNAGFMQIWTALIAYLLLVWLICKIKVGWGYWGIAAWLKLGSWNGATCWGSKL